MYSNSFFHFFKRFDTIVISRYSTIKGKVYIERRENDVSIDYRSDRKHADCEAQSGCFPEGASVYIKLESFNPGGSVKDRAARRMIERAEQEGKSSLMKAQLLSRHQEIQELD